jgi:hypothetical protein
MTLLRPILLDKTTSYALNIEITLDICKLNVRKSNYAQQLSATSVDLTLIAAD